MTFSSKEISKHICAGSSDARNGVVIIPPPDVKAVETSGESAVSLRLGRWFASIKQTSVTELDVLPSDSEGASETTSSKYHFVPFGHPFVIHPGRFVLGSTLEWIKLPATISGYVAGKSTWGRRGIIIETAAGVHPGFSGCLTLEIANLGEIPVKLRPGMEICQLFLHAVSGEDAASQTKLAGLRRPTLGKVKTDHILKKLSYGATLESSLKKGSGSATSSGASPSEPNTSKK